MSDPVQSSETRPDETHGRQRPSVHLPSPTIWPAVMAAGVALAMAGILLSLAFTVAGIVVFFIALGGWIQELRHDR